MSVNARTAVWFEIFAILAWTVLACILPSGWVLLPLLPLYVFNLVRYYRRLDGRFLIPRYISCYRDRFGEFDSSSGYYSLRVKRCVFRGREAARYAGVAAEFVRVRELRRDGTVTDPL